MTAAPGGPPPAGPLDRAVARAKALAGVVAPTTVLSALLLYFGYVATLARFAYFGVYLDLVDLSTRQLLLYGVEVIYVPLALLGSAGLVTLGVHAGLTLLLADPARRAALGGWSATVLLLTAILLLLRALVGMIRPSVAAAELPGTTPLSLTVGAVLATYAGRIARRVPAAPAAGGAPAPAWYDRPGLVGAWLVTASVVAVAGLFWAANSFAAAYGAGRALDDADGLPGRPEVLLVTTYRLHELSPLVQATETALSPAPGDPARYRYRGLRLLIADHDQLFLVPAPWIEGESRTLVLPRDSRVSIQLVP